MFSPYLSLLLTPFQNSINLLQRTHSLLTSYVKMVVFSHLDIDQFYLLRFPATSCCVHMKFTEWAMVPSQYHLLPNFKDYRSHFLHPKRHSNNQWVIQGHQGQLSRSVAVWCCRYLLHWEERLQQIAGSNKVSINNELFVKDCNHYWWVWLRLL